VASLAVGTRPPEGPPEGIELVTLAQARTAVQVEGVLDAVARAARAFLDEGEAVEVRLFRRRPATDGPRGIAA
jgi:hypothetical protein